MKYNKPLILARLICCVAFLTVAVLVFGPFGGAEEKFGLTDKEAHALAFFGLTSLSLLAMPRLRKLDVAICLVGIGGLIEIIQSLIGRDGDIMDWLADSIGISLSVVPMYFEWIRQAARGEKTHHPRRRRSDTGLVWQARSNRSRRTFTEGKG